MNKNWKRVAGFSLAAVMAMGMTVGCTKGNGGNSGTSGESEPVTLTYFMQSTQDWPLPKADNPVMKKLTEETNVTIEWVPGSGEDWKTKFNTIIAGGKDNLPDLMMNDAGTINNYGKQGAFIEIAPDVLESKMPNVKAQIDKSEYAQRALYDAETGKLFAIPRMNQMQNSMSWMVRKDWLKDVGITKEPETIDEFTAMLRAFKEKDPGKAGDRNVPFMLRNGASTFVPHAGPAWGLHWQGYTMDPNTRECTYNATTDAYKQELMWWNSLYKEGLIDAEFSTADTDRWQQYINQSWSGATLDYGVRTDQFTKELQKTNPEAEFGAITPPKGPDGKSGITCYTDALLDFSVGITSNCKNTDAAYRLLNYIYSDEGSWLLGCGIDGYTYDGVDENGNPNWKEDIKNDQAAIATVGKYGIMQPSSPRLLNNSEFAIMYGPLSMEAIEKDKNSWLEPYDNLVLTTEEDTELNTIYNDVATLVTEQSARFITGDRPFSDWDKFQNELKQKKVDRLEELYTQGQKAAGEKLAAINK